MWESYIIFQASTNYSKTIKVKIEKAHYAIPVDTCWSLIMLKNRITDISVCASTYQYLVDLRSWVEFLRSWSYGSWYPDSWHHTKLLTEKKLAAHYAAPHSSGVEPHIPVVFMSHSSARLAIITCIVQAYYTVCCPCATFSCWCRGWADNYILSWKKKIQLI